MDIHSIVVISLHSPKEKIWGELLSINPFPAVTLRGIDLNSFDHFVIRSMIPTASARDFYGFFPMNRVERIRSMNLRGSIPSMAEIFARKPAARSRELSGAICMRRFADRSLPGSGSVEF